MHTRTPITREEKGKKKNEQVNICGGSKGGITVAKRWKWGKELRCKTEGRDGTISWAPGSDACGLPDQKTGKRGLRKKRGGTEGTTIEGMGNGAASEERENRPKRRVSALKHPGG